MATIVKKGTKFRWHYADGNPLWVVKKSRGNKTWDCEITGDDVDFPGVQQVFTTSQIESSLRQSDLYSALVNAQDRWYASQKPGEIVHYSNGRNQYVRCEIVQVVADGKVCNQLKPIALVGEWREYDLPHYSITGKVVEGYHAKQIRNGEVFEPNFSNIYEASNNLKERIDPRNLPPIDLTLPEMTAEQADKAFMWQTIYSVRELLGGESLEGDLYAEYIANPLKTLNDANVVLQNALLKIRLSKINSASFVTSTKTVTLQGPDDD